MRDFLSPSQRSSIRQAHRLERDRKIADRMKAVLWSDAGEGVPRIAALLLIDENTVRRHIKDYFDNDKLGGGSGGSQGKLTDEQSERLRELLASCDVPTAAEAADKARGLLGIKFTVSGMTDWLHRMGFSFKKCEPVPAKADPAEQAAFAAGYEQLKAGLAPGEAIFFLDACHPSQATKVGYAWSPKGARKNVPSRPGQRRVNVVGSLDPATLTLVTSFHDKVDSDAIVQHFKKLRRLHPSHQTLHVILDQGSYNRSAATAEAAAALGIELWFLPPYSPNLNLIERMWKLMNEKVRNNVSFESFAEFEATIKKFLQKSWRGLRKSSRARFVDRFQVLNPTF
jgi:transposase